MVRESHYGDIISEISGATSNSNSSISTPNTDTAIVILFTYTPVHPVPNCSDYWDPGDFETVRINLYNTEVSR